MQLTALHLPEFLINQTVQTGFKLNFELGCFKIVSIPTSIHGYNNSWKVFMQNDKCSASTYNKEAEPKMHRHYYVFIFSILYSQ